MFKRVLIVVTMVVGMFSSTGSCQALQDRIGVDKCAHFGISYVIEDQLKEHTKMTPLERVATTVAIGYCKERFIDDHFDNGDFIADFCGVLFYESKF